MKVFCLVIATLALCGLAASADSLPYYYSVNGTAVTAPGAPVQKTSGGDSGQSLTPVSITYSESQPEGFASLAASANMVGGLNELHALLTANAGTVQFGSAGDVVYATYKDTLTFNITGVYRFSLHLDASIDAGYPDYHTSSGQVNVTELDGGIFFGQDLRTYLQPDAHLAKLDATADIYIEAGTVQTIELQLNATAFAGAYFDLDGNEVGASTIVDASDTGYLTIDPLDGGTFTSASGSTYVQPTEDSSAVPEPATLTMLVSGITALVLKSRGGIANRR